MRTDVLLWKHDPCEQGRNLTKWNQPKSDLRTFLERESDNSNWISPEDVIDDSYLEFESQDLGIGVAKTTPRVSNKETQSNFIDLSCPQTLQYYFERDQQKLMEMLVIDPEVVGAVRILHKKKYKHGKPTKSRYQILVA